jgi:peptidoglycan/LPS O-acetylase OafA/YrhL
LIKAFRLRLTPLSLFLVATAVTTLFAIASWQLVEKPFLRLKRSSRPSQERPELADQPIGQPASIDAMPA